MGQLERVTRRSAPSRWAHLKTALRSFWTGPLTASSIEGWLFGGARTSTGLHISEETALTYAAFWSAVSRISADVASLPLILYKREANGGKTRFTNHPLYWLLHDEPNPEMSAMVFRETLQAHVLTWGNAYAEIERNGAGRPYALWPLAPTRVAPFRPKSDPYGPLRYRVSNPDGADTILSAADMLHVPGLGYDGCLGYSVVAKARESLGLSLATERFGSTFFENGSSLGGVFAHPKVFGPGAQDNFEKSVKAKTQGLDRAHNFIVVQEGMTYTQLGVPPNDAQFLETRKFQIAEVARWFNIPAHKLGDLEHATFSNIEHMAIEYVSDTLRPWLVRWEQEINRKLIAPQEKGIQFVEHLMDALLRGDIQSRYAAYAVGRQWGWLSADDICGFENLNPLPNGQGKSYLVPQNMWPADKLDEMLDAQKSKGTPPAADPVAREALKLLEQRLAIADASVVHAQQEAERERMLRAAVDQTLTATQAEREAAQKAEALAVAHAAHVQALADTLRPERDAAVSAFELEQTRRVEADTSRHVAETARDAGMAVIAERDASLADAQEHARLAMTNSAEANRLAAEATGAADALRTEAEMARREAETARVNQQATASQQAEAEARAVAAEARASQADADQATAAETARQAAAQADTFRAEVERLTAAVDASQGRVTAAEASIAALQAERDQAQGALSVATAQAESTEAARLALVEDVEAERQAVQALSATAADLRTQIADREGSLVSERGLSATAVAALRDQLASVERERDAAVSVRAALDQQVAAAKAALVQAEALHRQAADLVTDGDAAILAAHRDLALDTMKRLVDVEITRAQQAGKSPEKLRAWVDTFYEGHEERCVTALLPVVRVHLAWRRSSDDPETVTRELVRDHVDLSRRQLRAVVDEAPADLSASLHGLTRRWEAARVSTIPDLLFQQEIDYARRHPA